MKWKVLKISKVNDSGDLNDFTLNYDFIVDHLVNNEPACTDLNDLAIMIKMSMLVHFEAFDLRDTQIANIRQACNLLSGDIQNRDEYSTELATTFFDALKKFCETGDVRKFMMILSRFSANEAAAFYDVTKHILKMSKHVGNPYHAYAVAAAIVHVFDIYKDKPLRMPRRSDISYYEQIKIGIATSNGLDALKRIGSFIRATLIEFKEADSDSRIVSDSEEDRLISTKYEMIYDFIITSIETKATNPIAQEFFQFCEACCATDKVAAEYLDFSNRLVEADYATLDNFIFQLGRHVGYEANAIDLASAFVHTFNMFGDEDRFVLREMQVDYAADIPAKTGRPVITGAQKDEKK